MPPNTCRHGCAAFTARAQAANFKKALGLTGSASTSGSTYSRSSSMPYCPAHSRSRSSTAIRSSTLSGVPLSSDSSATARHALPCMAGKIISAFLPSIETEFKRPGREQNAIACTTAMGFGLSMQIGNAAPFSAFSIRNRSACSSSAVVAAETSRKSAPASACARAILSIIFPSPSAMAAAIDGTAPFSFSPIQSIVFLRLIF